MAVESETASTFFDLRLWVALGALVLGVINFFVSRRDRRESTERDERIEKNNLRLAEFRDQVRAPILAVFPKLEQCEDELAALAANFPDNNTSELSRLNKLFPEINLALKRSLQKADESRFVIGEDWASLSDRLSEDVGPMFNKAYNHTLDKVDRVEAIKGISKKLSETRAAINRKCEEQIGEFTGSAQ